jgi:RHS repeat-associated protein
LPLYIFDDWNLIDEHNSSDTQQAKYIHGPAIDEMLVRTTPADTAYYHQDGLGSTTALTNPTGTLLERYRYDVFGAPTFLDATGTAVPSSPTSNRFQYTGREYLAELSLYDYRNRVYQAELGRFLQTDPIGFDAEDVNLYRYVANNPVDWVDPLGLMVKGTPVPIDPKSNSIVCKGGKLTVQNNNSGPGKDCTQIHEEKHVEDWKGRYGDDLCKGVPDGQLPVGGPGYKDFLKKSECEAYKAGKESREKKLKNCPESDKEQLKKEIEQDEKQIKKYCS